MKKILFYIVAVSVLPAVAVNVTTESALVTALSGADKNVTITKSFTTSKDITVPAGYTVTLADGVVLTLGYSEGFWGFGGYSRILSGDGVIVTAKKTVYTRATKYLPSITPVFSNPDTLTNASFFNGISYEETYVVTEGGDIKKTKAEQLQCKCQSAVSVDGGENYVPLDISPAAVSCKVSQGINGGRVFYKAYTTMEAALDDENFSTCPEVANGNGRMVILLSDGEFEMSKEKYSQRGIVFDCAGFNGKIKRKGGVFGIGATGEFGSTSVITFLNANSASAPKLTNSDAVFINCKNASIAEINGNCTSHIYDCGSVSLGSYSEGGAYFYCGGPYSVTFGNNYWAYGGTYLNEPKPMSGYEAVPEDDIWAVQKPADVENLVYIGETGYPTLQSAVDAASSGDEIVLKFNLSLDAPVTVPEDKNITINFAGLNIEAVNGAFINNGTLRLEDASGVQIESAITTSAGNLIENNGNLEITYGRYSGDILHNTGILTVHNGEFNGEIRVAHAAAVNLLGGRFKNSVAQFLSGDYIEKLYSGYHYVGKFPYAAVSDTMVSGTDKGWKIAGLASSDHALYVNSSGVKSNYANPADWYRRAEIMSMLTPYEDLTVDFVIKFDRAVKSNTVSAKALGNTVSLDRDLAANESFRALSSKMTGYHKRYTLFLKEYGSEVSAGIKNNDVAANAGTVCTIEFQLCHSNRTTNVIETDYVLASVSYRFPWADDIPELREDDTPETVASALGGTADAKVLENIKDVQAYNSYQKWTTGVKGATAVEIKAAPNAWLSYALNTTNLVEKPAAGDLKIDSLAPSATETGAFALELSLKDIDIGSGNVSDEVMRANLDKVFGIEGAASLDPDAFSTDNVVYSFGTPVNGKVPVEARSADGSADRFFMRARCVAE